MVRNCALLLVACAGVARGFVSIAPRRGIAAIPRRRSAAGAARAPIRGEAAPLGLNDVAPVSLVSSRLVRTSVVLLVPAVAAGVGALLAFPAICAWMRGTFGVATLTVLSGDQGQFIQNFLAVIGILFSLLIGNTYAFCYNQQVAIYTALFVECSVAKSLLEQATLVCQGRPSYAKVLDAVQSYVDRDLKRGDLPPAVLLSARPRDDPLEAIMWMTSVGTPSAIYDTVRQLRQARGERLGAVQRKLPPLHFALLAVLGVLEICAFPLLSAGASLTVGAGVLRVEGAMFALMAAALVLTLGVVVQLWRPRGSAYSADAALAVLVAGLDAELAARRADAGKPPADLPPPREYP